MLMEDVHYMGDLQVIVAGLILNQHSTDYVTFTHTAAGLLRTNTPPLMCTANHTSPPSTTGGAGVVTHAYLAYWFSLLEGGNAKLPQICKDPFPLQLPQTASTVNGPEVIPSVFREHVKIACTKYEPVWQRVYTDLLP